MHSTVCLETAESCLSKSNMPSPVTIGAVEIAGYVGCNRLLERREAGVIACPPQILDRALREILVLTADRIRHLDVFDIGRFPERLEHRRDHVAEAFRLAGADVEDAADRRRAEQPAHNRNRV